MDKIVIYSLNGCGFSKKAINTLKKKYITHEVFHVDWNNKDHYKKSNNMNTFPQIFFQKKNSNRIKIGGSNDLDYLLNTINNTKKNKQFDNMVITIKNKLSLDKRTTLQIIDLLK